MVSHHSPPYAPSSAPPAPPRAASVTSGRSSGTRRHRHARTHYSGASAHLPQNEFPVFAHTGDVEIVIRTANGRKEKIYMLHRLILSQNSGFFNAGTREEWSGRAGGTGLGGGLARINEGESGTIGSSSRASSQERRSQTDPERRKWYYELDWEAVEDDDPPMLVQRETRDPTSIFGGGGHAPPPVRNKPPASSESFFRSVSNFSTLTVSDRLPPASAPAEEPGDHVLKDYDNLFRAIYQYPPNLDTINIANAYTEAKALLHLADMYDALEVVGSRVDHHMLRFGARLFKQIAKYPPSYLKLGYLAKSKTIFTEALIHVVGQWPLAAPQLRGNVEMDIIEIIEDKVDELNEMQERVESKLWRLNLTTSRGERVTPSNDFLSWLAVSLFRQWFAENTTPAPPGILKDSARPASGSSSTRGASRSSHHIASQRGSQPPPPPPAAPPAPISVGRVYRLIGSTDPIAYLNRDELKRFLKTPSAQGVADVYTRDSLKRFERRMDEMKNLARQVVQPLMRNFLELDLRDFGASGLGYLTCTRVERRDLPWDEG